MISPKDEAMRPARCVLQKIHRYSNIHTCTHTHLHAYSVTVYAETHTVRHSSRLGQEGAPSFFPMQAPVLPPIQVITLQTLQVVLELLRS